MCSIISCIIYLYVTHLYIIKLGNKVYWVSDGEEALDYLFRHGKYADKEKSPRPDLIYLVKPVDFGEFSEMIRDLGHYWLVLNKKK